MADPLLYNALDAYLYSDTQLAAATSQADTQEAVRAAGVPLLQCCICCACLCQAALDACNAGGGPGGSQEIIDQYSTLWACYDGLFDNHGDTGWTTCCYMWPGCMGQCSANGIMCCQITVPSNVNCMQIDMWAAGGNSWGANCCGGSHYGHTGGFVSIVMPTCAGWNYTLCAGCALCCWIGSYAAVSTWYGAPPGRHSCMSGCNFEAYARGGPQELQRRLWTNTITYGRRPNQCFGHKCSGSGQCWCNAGYFCYDNSCASCGWNPHGAALGTEGFVCYSSPSVITTAHSPAKDTAEAFTVPGHTTRFCWDTNFYGKMEAPRPPRRTSECEYYCMCFTSGTCCGGCLCRWGQGINQWPGMGGYASKVQSGGCICGDMGRGGAFRVIYKTCS